MKKLIGKAKKGMDTVFGALSAETWLTISVVTGTGLAVLHETRKATNYLDSRIAHVHVQTLRAVDLLNLQVGYEQQQS
jgi:hypothetical protein